MPPVPERVLHWLYNNLKSQYAFADRTYSDIVQSLTTYPSLSPKTDVYTYDNGSSALLLQLHGTIPVQYRNAEYRYPVAVWLPQDYPQQAPMVHVIPKPDMRVRPGQHVSVEGRLYHPYMAQWGSHWERSSLSGLIQLLLEIFAKEPPLYYPHAEMQRPSSTALQANHDDTRHKEPPRPPPKVSAGSDPKSEARLAERSLHRPNQMMPPSLPPKPPTSASPASYGLYSHYGDQNTQRASQDPRLQSPVQDLPMAGRHRPGVDGLQRDQRFQPQMPPRATLTQRSNTHGFSAQQDPSSRFVPPYYSTQPSSQTVSHSKPAPDVRKPVEDLMSSPLDPAASATTNMVSIPAPPIPPNPEKDALLRTISASLNSQIVQITSKNVSAIPSLESQYTAMQQAHQDMGSEVAQLKSLDAMLSSNEKLLHETLRDADKKMESVRNKEKPNVDDVLVAPTTVAEQLYGLVAEEQSLGDAMFALTRALDRGRISAEVYTKQTRTLAREQFLKKALIRKIARGLQLDGV